MKKKVLFLILITFSLLLTSCIDYSNYKDVYIPNENVGSVKIPSYWEFEVVDDWIQIIDTEKGEVIGVQYYKGDYYIINQIVHDERLYNPYFDEYESIWWDYESGNSNGSQYGIRRLEKNETIFEYRFICFDGSSDSKNDIEIIIIDDLVENSVLSNIAKSYKR